MTVRIQPATAPEPAAQAMLDGIHKLLGSTPNIFTTMAHSPAVLGLYLQGSEALKATKLSRKLHEQIALAVADANGCDYCASAHTQFGAMHKLSPQELSNNLRGLSADAKTQAALVFARAVTQARGHVSNAELDAVRTAGYSDAEILEIVAIVSINTFTNYFNNVAGTAIDFTRVETSKAAHAA